MATIRDVAKASGVSVTTVSVVLNNAPRPVNPETRQRVLAAARHLNYHPDVMARGLVSRRAHSLGVQFTSVEPAIVTNYFASGVLSGILSEGANRQQDIHIFTTPWDNATTSGPRVKAQRTDGVLAIAPHIGSDIAAGLQAVGMPVVVVSSPSNTDGVPYVDVDNVTGGKIAVEHLLQLGHRHIAYIHADGTQQSEKERETGYQLALCAAGLTVRPEYIVGEFYPLDQIPANLARLMALPEPPTAIFACNDSIAFHLLKAAREMQITVPEQLSVIGFDDAPFSTLTAPGVTTIHHPLREVGTLATRLLMDCIEGLPVPEKHLCPPSLIVRGTTAPPPKL